MTLWQRPHLFVWDWSAAPVELLRPLQPLYGAVHVHLIDHVVPYTYVQQLRQAGFSVFGVIGDYDREGKPWQRWQDPLEAFQAELDRLGPMGADFNFEDRWEEHDRISQGQWSLNLTMEFRKRWPRRNLCLNTYDECGHIALRTWADFNARLYLQTYKGGVEPPAMIPVAALKDWALRNGWPRRKVGFIRPCLGVFKGSTGERVPVEAQVASMKEGGTKGLLTYYADGAFDVDYLGPLGRGAIAAGAAL